MQETMYVGIDVSRDTLDVSFRNHEEELIRPAMTVENGHDGWKKLTDAMLAVVAQRGDDIRIVCGMESTSNFHKCLEQVLCGETRHELEVHVINPLSVRSFGRALLKEAKTDKTDSDLIAKYLRRMEPELGYRAPAKFEELKAATRMRRELIEERTRYKNRLHQMLRVHFPGYRQYVGNQVTRQLLVVIKEMPSPDRVLERTVDEIASVKIGPRHCVRVGFAEKLRKLAELAPRGTLLSATMTLLRTTASHILELNDSISELDAEVEKNLDELCPGHHLRSIPGIGPVSTAAILAEVGDISRFPTVRHFIGYCGLYPIVRESGQSKHRYRMTRKGNRMLKMTLLVASTAAHRYNPVVAAFHDRQLGKGKSKKAAGGASARKLAELVYTILSKDEPWSAKTACSGLAKAEAMVAKQRA